VVRRDARPPADAPHRVWELALFPCRIRAQHAPELLTVAVEQRTRQHHLAQREVLAAFGGDERHIREFLSHRAMQQRGCAGGLTARPALEQAQHCSDALWADHRDQLRADQSSCVPDQVGVVVGRVAGHTNMLAGEIGRERPVHQ